MYKISLDNLNKIIQYLASKPYAEVFQLVSLIQSLEQIKEEVKPANETEVAIESNSQI